MESLDRRAPDEGRTLEELRVENQLLRKRLIQAEATLDELESTVAAIRGGLVDAVVVDREELPEIWTLEAADQLYLRLALQSARATTWDCHLAEQDADGEDLESLLGLDCFKPRGSRERWRSLVHAEDRARVATRLGKVISEGGDYYDEFRIVHPNGEVHWLAARGQLVRGPEGEPSRLVGVHLDITERRQAEELLREADRKKNEFLAMLAHELRNPLGAISNAVHLIRMPHVSSDDRRWVEEMLDQQVQQLSRLIDDLLDISRITQGKIELKWELLDLNRLVQRTIETLQPHLSAAKHELSVAYQAGPVWLRGDAARLEQVLVNLLSNAVKYTPESGRIWVRVAQTGSEAVVEVKDNGIGISAEMLSRVFELFTQAEQGPDRSQGGLGIGLSVVRRLVEMHGGQVVAASEGLGRGSTFLVRLPTSDPPKESEGAPGSDLTSAADARRILIVDDNRGAAMTLSLLLKTCGHETATTYSGSAALSLLHSFQADIALLDLGLPDMTGFELAQRIRQQSSSMTLIAVSGYGQPEDIQRSREAGFDAHLVKPVNQDELFALIHRGGESSP